MNVTFTKTNGDQLFKRMKKAQFEAMTVFPLDYWRENGVIRIFASDNSGDHLIEIGKKPVAISARGASVESSVAVA